MLSLNYNDSLDSTFMRPFWCPATILNTIDHLRKFDGKTDEGSGPNSLFVIDATKQKLLYSISSCSMGINLMVVQVQKHVMMQSSPDAGFKPSGEDKKKVTEEPGKEGGNSSNDQEKDDNINSTNNINTASDGNNTNNVNVVSSTVNTAGIEDNAVDENIVYRCADDPNMPHLEEIGRFSDNKDIEAMQEELLQFKLQEVWTLVELPNGKQAIVAQGYTKEEGIEYDEVFAPVAKIEAIRLFLAYASFKDFMVYHIDVKSDFLYGKIEEEVYVYQLPGFEDPLPELGNRPCPLILVENRYLKGQPKLGLWYPKDSPFNLVECTNSDYVGASLDKKSTTGGCQVVRCILISWQCKKQTVVANYITEAEYVAASSCCGQVLWIQNQLLDYGHNFMHTKIYIDNESTICIVKNPVFYSKTKHIEIRHHFIRDSNEKKLIQMIKIHTDKNVADLTLQKHLM
ncbi:putative ribonuclease H-like domain-containing protein [Tanacetum coccineum]